MARLQEYVFWNDRIGELVPASFVLFGTSYDRKVDGLACRNPVVALKNILYFSSSLLNNTFSVLSLICFVP